MGGVLSVGVIGTGGIAQSHMRAIEANDNIRLVAAMDVVAERAEAAVDKYGGKAYMSLEDLLGDPDVEAVHVCTPHSLHIDHAPPLRNVIILFASSHWYFDFSGDLSGPFQFPIRAGLLQMAYVVVS